MGKHSKHYKDEYYGHHDRDRSHRRRGRPTTGESATAGSTSQWSEPFEDPEGAPISWQHRTTADGAQEWIFAGSQTGTAPEHQYQGPPADTSTYTMNSAQHTAGAYAYTNQYGASTAPSVNQAQTTAMAAMQTQMPYQHQYTATAGYGYPYSAGYNTGTVGNVGATQQYDANYGGGETTQRRSRSKSKHKHRSRRDRKSRDRRSKKEEPNWWDSSEDDDDDDEYGPL